MTKVANCSSVTAIDGGGQQMPWNDVSRFDDDAMHDLMRRIADRVYIFQVVARSWHI